MRQKMSGRPPQPEKAEAGGPFFIFCILEVLALDNPRTAVYNKDKERRWLRSGQLPFWMSDFIRKMTAQVGKSGAVIFLVIF